VSRGLGWDSGSSPDPPAAKTRRQRARLADTSLPLRSVTAFTRPTTDCEPRSTPSMPVTLSARPAQPAWGPREDVQRVVSMQARVDRRQARNPALPGHSRKHAARSPVQAAAPGGSWQPTDKMQLTVYTPDQPQPGPQAPCRPQSVSRGSAFPDGRPCAHRLPASPP